MKASSDRRFTGGTASRSGSAILVDSSGVPPGGLARRLLALARWALGGSVVKVRFAVSPGAGNVIPGSVEASLDVRHVDDAVRRELVARLLGSAEQTAKRRCLTFSWEQRLDQPAVAMDSALTQMLEIAVANTGHPVHRMASGAGHDAMIVARQMPAAMLFLRSPGGISHHPDETVLAEDVAAALDVGVGLLEQLEQRHA